MQMKWHPILPCMQSADQLNVRWDLQYLEDLTEDLEEHQKGRKVSPFTPCCWQRQAADKVEPLSLFGICF